MLGCIPLEKVLHLRRCPDRFRNLQLSLFLLERVYPSVNPPAEYSINNQVDITGGTGRLAGASGFLRTHGTVNLQTGVVSVDYHGRISTP